MKTGILSDIHGNFTALSAVLEDIKRHNPDRLICLGDVVGYGAEPGRCVDTIAEVCEITIKGNHDLAVADPKEIGWFNDEAAAALFWTIKQLNDEQKRFVCHDLVDHYEDTIPFGDKFRLSFWHAAPHSGWGYAMMHPLHRQILKDRENGIISFMGHTHLARFYRPGKSDLPPISLEINRVDQAEHVMLYNVGSVGQPRDNDPWAAYAIADHDAGTIYNFRVPYDVDEAASKIREARLPESLARRLYVGR